MQLRPKELFRVDHFSSILFFNVHMYAAIYQLSAIDYRTRKNYVCMYIV